MSFDSDIHNIVFNEDEHREKRKTSVKLVNRGFPYNWKRWRGFLSNIKWFFKDISDFFRRGKNGYVPFDSVDAGGNIVRYIIVILTEFRNNADSYPDYAFDSFKEWVAFIDTIIDLLEFSDQDPDDFNKYYTKFNHYCENPWGKMSTDIYDSWYRENERVTKLQEAARKKAFQMLSEHIDDLWN